mmetsp:Transcript_6640/g.20101  ORF Transcript_6640/g.20101 Transcript_6640/m.20101 type:complete len:202 (-) Transcript_6640:451-1056(-)
MATQSKTPRILFTTSVESASPVTSSAMMSRGSLDFTIASRIGMISWMLFSFMSVIRTLGFLSSTTCLSWSLMKYGDRKPLSSSIPSVNSTSSSRLCDSSTIVDPFAPERSKDVAMMSPILSSLPAEIVATARRSSIPLMVLDSLLTSLLTRLAAISIPLRIMTGLRPALTPRIPSFTIAWHRTVEVVVPSPALMSVFAATS